MITLTLTLNEFELLRYYINNDGRFYDNIGCGDEDYDDAFNSAQYSLSDKLRALSKPAKPLKPDKNALWRAIIDTCKS